MGEPQDPSNQEKRNAFPLEEGEMLKLILENIPARIFWKDLQSRFLGSNQKFANDAGVVNSSALIGKTDYDMVWKKDADWYVKVDSRVMATGKPEVGIVEPQMRADGTKTWLETNKIPLIDNKGETIGLLGTYNDITDRIASNEKLEQYARDLESKNNELEQFAFVAAHDLQEPLRTTLSSVNLLEDGYKDKLDEEGQIFLRFIKESTNRMINLVTNILQYSTMGRDIKLEPIDVHSLCSKVIEDLKEAISEAGATVEIENELPLVLASSLELRMIFQNLIGNALKFVKPGTAPVIKVSCQETTGHWQFSVSDNGIGIKDEHHDKVFKIFQRLHNRSEYKGTGMGLATCEKLITILGGDIWFNSEEGEGTTFHFTLKKNG